MRRSSRIACLTMVGVLTFAIASMHQIHKTAQANMAPA